VTVESILRSLNEYPEKVGEQKAGSADTIEYDGLVMPYALLARRGIGDSIVQSRVDSPK
jgi:hypothetical protein